MLCARKGCPNHIVCKEIINERNWILLSWFARVIFTLFEEHFSSGFEKKCGSLMGIRGSHTCVRTRQVALTATRTRSNTRFIREGRQPHTNEQNGNGVKRTQQKDFYIYFSSCEHLIVTHFIAWLRFLVTAIASWTIKYIIR